MLGKVELGDFFGTFAIVVYVHTTELTLSV
jgi:hypothetical protein